jgi:hypothetical protein
MKLTITPLVFLLLILSGCSQLMLKPVDFAWPVESVLKVDDKGMVQDDRYILSVNVKTLLFAETNDSVNVSNVTLRVIRDLNGYYYITAAKFKNVYVFEQTDGGLKLTKKILVAQNGLDAPAFNQRTPYVQLMNDQNPPVMLTKDGIVEGEKK